MNGSSYAASALLTAMLLLAPGCDRDVEVGTGAKLIELDSYTLVVDSATSREVLVSPHIVEYAVAGEYLLGERREILMPVQKLAEESEFFIYGPAGIIGVYRDRPSLLEGARAIGISDSLAFTKTPAPIGS